MSTPKVAYSVRRAYLIWAAATAAYVVAVVQRTSLGVSGLEAAERFGASAAILSLFTVGCLFRLADSGRSSVGSVWGAQANNCWRVDDGNGPIWYGLCGLG